MDLKELKQKYLFDESGMIRQGIESMSDYAKILYAVDEDDLDRVISEIMENNPDIESIDFQEIKEEE